MGTIFQDERVASGGGVEQHLGGNGAMAANRFARTVSCPSSDVWGAHADRLIAVTTVRGTRDELARWQLAAKTERLPMSAWLRKLAEAATI